MALSDMEWLIAVAVVVGLGMILGIILGRVWDKASR